MLEIDFNHAIAATKISGEPCGRFDRRSAKQYQIHVRDALPESTRRSFEPNIKSLTSGLPASVDACLAHKTRAFGKVVAVTAASSENRR